MMPREEEAIQVDAYLDELLATVTIQAPRALPEPIGAELDAIAHLVQRALARFHPSFRFEERLANRLALEADAGVPSAAGLGGSVPIRGAGIVPAAAGAQPTALELRGRGGLLLGGAIASGVSIAGAALIARARRVRAEQRWQELS